MTGVSLHYDPSAPCSWTFTPDTALRCFGKLPSCARKSLYAAAIPVLSSIVGDHPSLRSSLRTILEIDPQIRVVGEAADDCETVKMAKRLRPDVVLVDLEMRCCDSFDALEEITRRKLANAVIGLTIHDDKAGRNAAQDAGVDLLLQKGISYKQLINAVRRVGANQPPE